MSLKKSVIPNPNKMSDLEQTFISNKPINMESLDDKNIKTKFTGRMISMPDSFYKKLNEYLKDHPTEGSKSSFIVRIVAEYIDRKLDQK